MTYRELQKEAKRLNLSAGGNTEALRKRIADHLAKLKGDTDTDTGETDTGDTGDTGDTETEAYDAFRERCRVAYTIPGHNVNLSAAEFIDHYTLLSVSNEVRKADLESKDNPLNLGSRWPHTSAMKFVAPLLLNERFKGLVTSYDLARLPTSDKGKIERPESAVHAVDIGHPDWEGPTLLLTRQGQDYLLSCGCTLPTDPTVRPVVKGKIAVTTKIEADQETGETFKSYTWTAPPPVRLNDALRALANHANGWLRSEEQEREIVELVIAKIEEGAFGTVDAGIIELLNEFKALDTNDTSTDTPNPWSDEQARVAGQMIARCVRHLQKIARANLNADQTRHTGWLAAYDELEKLTANKGTKKAKRAATAAMRAFATSGKKLVKGRKLYSSMTPEERRYWLNETFATELCAIAKA